MHELCSTCCCEHFLGALPFLWKGRLEPSVLRIEISNSEPFSLLPYPLTHAFSDHAFPALGTLCSPRSALVGFHMNSASRTRDRTRTRFSGARTVVLAVALGRRRNSTGRTQPLSPVFRRFSGSILSRVILLRQDIAAGRHPQRK